MAGRLANVNQPQQPRSPFVFPAHIPRDKLRLGQRVVVAVSQANNLQIFFGTILACNDRRIMIKEDVNSVKTRKFAIKSTKIQLFAEEDWQVAAFHL
ncbi:unnamed protein product [Anisakis simplex]|uniref:KOW domain-containing protein n=1 Tax=Anisakis simplex TaxID=6269 RepID=A0A0M3JXK5_ANISI|nr:unnamed protein product [Anisakis simplex]